MSAMAIAMAKLHQAYHDPCYGPSSGTDNQMSVQLSFLFCTREMTYFLLLSQDAYEDHMR